MRQEMIMEEAMGMEPTRETHATLVDLLDRVLEKGLVIHADIIISVAGIPLIGVNLRAALAGMETMLKYGMMQAWDERVRAWEREYRARRKESLIQGEEVLLRMFGSYYYSEGIYAAWRTGYLYLTDTRLLLCHEDFEEVLFEAPLEKIKALALRRDTRLDGKDKEKLCLSLEGGQVAQLRAADAAQLKEAIQEAMSARGLAPDSPPPHPEPEEGAEFLTKGEEVLCRGDVWHMTPLPTPGGGTTDTWQAGRLYVTDRRLLWQYGFNQSTVFEIPIGEVTAFTVEKRDISPLVKKRKVLDVIYGSNGAKRVASFSTREWAQWERALGEITSRRDAEAPSGEVESCPRCGREAPVEELLQKGCPRCGWISPRSGATAPRVATPPGTY